MTLMWEVSKQVQIRFRLNDIYLSILQYNTQYFLFLCRFCLNSILICFLFFFLCLKCSKDKDIEDKSI